MQPRYLGLLGEINRTWLASVGAIGARTAAPPIGVSAVPIPQPRLQGNIDGPTPPPVTGEQEN